MIAPLRAHAAAAFSLAKDISAKWPTDRPQFDLQTGWTHDYACLFAGKFERILSEAEILDKVLVRGRAIIAGRGGDGKTWMLRRLYAKTLDRGALPILLDLKQWSGADYEEWRRWTTSELSDATDFL